MQCVRIFGLFHTASVSGTFILESFLTGERRICCIHNVCEKIKGCKKSAIIFVNTECKKYFFL